MQRETKNPKQTKGDREAPDPHPERLITDLGKQTDHSFLGCAWTHTVE